MLNMISTNNYNMPVIHRKGLTNEGRIASGAMTHRLKDYISTLKGVDYYV